MGIQQEPTKYLWTKREVTLINLTGVGKGAGQGAEKRPAQYYSSQLLELHKSVKNDSGEISETIKICHALSTLHFSV